MQTVETPEHGCPACGKKLTRATSTRTDRGPKSGDLSICVGCCAILMFNDDMTSRELTDADRAWLEKHHPKTLAAVRDAAMELLSMKIERMGKRTKE